MNPLTRTTDYLRHRDTRNHVGAKLLIKHELFDTKVEEIMAEAIQLLQREFTKTSTTASAQCKLTAVSTLIGEMAAAKLGSYDRVSKEGLQWWDIIKIGDLILESFLQCGYIKIEYTHFDVDEKMYCYIVTWTDDWPGIDEIDATLFIRGSTIKKPESLSFRNPMTGLPTIKNMYSEELFNTLSSQRFFKAGSKLQQTAWKINDRVLDTIITQRNKFNLENKSKKTEYDLITLKGKALSLYPKFYQYIDYDYRGRIYYTESFLNFQGSDLARGIMLFAKGHKLTQEGLWWLAVHTASSFNKSYPKDEIHPGLKVTTKNT